MNTPKRMLHQIAPRDWDMGALSFAHEIAVLLQPVIDSGTSVDSGGSDGEANLWASVGGVEYFVTIRKSQRQRTRESTRYRCPTCSGEGEIAPDADCPDCDGTGSCVPPPA